MRSFIVTILVAFMFPGIVLAEEIKVEGGAAAITTVFNPIKEAYESSSGNTLSISLTTPVKSLLSLKKGTVDLAAMNSFSLDAAIKKTNEQGADIDPASLVITYLTQSHLVIFLNQSNKVSGLSKAQLKGIFTGKIKNWKDLGGDDRLISVYWGKETPILNQLFMKEILDGEPVTKAAKSAADHFNLRDIVLSDPSAIVINTSGLVMPKLKVPSIPIIKLPLIAVTMGKPSPKVQQVLDFYKKEFGYLTE